MSLSPSSEQNQGKHLAHLPRRLMEFKKIYSNICQKSLLFTPTFSLKYSKREKSCSIPSCCSIALAPCRYNRMAWQHGILHYFFPPSARILHTLKCTWSMENFIVNTCSCTWLHLFSSRLVCLGCYQ